MTEEEKQAKAKENQDKIIAKYKEYGKFVPAKTWGIDEEMTSEIVKSIHVELLGKDKEGKTRPFSDLHRFLMIANQQKLNPMKGQIHATYIWDSQIGGEKLIPIVGINGQRAIAQRSERPLYAGSNLPQYKEDKDGNLKSVIVEVCAYNPVTGAREVIASAEAFLSEYAKMVDEYVEVKNPDGTPKIGKYGKPVKTKTGKRVMNSTWANMTHVMLAKCAESMALRKAFPEQLGGIYEEAEIEHLRQEEPKDESDIENIADRISEALERRRRGNAEEAEVVEKE